MTRWLGVLLLAALAIPASLSLPSARAASGASCPMSCAHGDAKACCCLATGAGASLRRCGPGDGGFTPGTAVKLLLPPIEGVPVPLPLAGWLAVAFAIFLLPSISDRPDPIPKRLS